MKSLHTSGSFRDQIEYSALVFGVRLFEFFDSLTKVDANLTVTVGALLSNPLHFVVGNFSFASKPSRKNTEETEKFTKGRNDAGSEPPQQE
jgi:hypothetical protein